MPPLWTQVKVPPYCGWLAPGGVVVVVVVVEEVEVVVVAVVVEEVDLPQLMVNNPVKIIIVSAISKILFILPGPP
jgi:hypothetical protein